MTSAFFSKVPEPEPDAIHGINNAYLACTAPEKVNLVMGTYRTNEGKPWLLSCVKEAERRLHDSQPFLEYGPLDGDADFREAARIICFGAEWNSKNASRVMTCQSLSGTGALKLGLDFIKKFMPNKKVYVPVPTWENHPAMVTDCFLECGTYKYYDPIQKGLDFEGYKESLLEAPEGSVFLIHAIAHNPTGVDPSQEQWREIAKIVQQKKHLTFFDNAYQGFASGSLEKDGFALRLWNEMNMEYLLAQSFSKSLGLYGTRTGAFHIVTYNAEAVRIISGQMKRIARSNYSSPPHFGSRLVTIIVNSPELFEMWKEDMRIMSTRLLECRQMLFDELTKLGTPGDWTHIKKQIGMFTFSGLTHSQVQNMIDHYHVYLLMNGRISLSGITSHNVAHVAKAIHGVVTGDMK